jgi:hypothetical protein
VDVVVLDRELADAELVLLAAVDEHAAQDRAELEIAKPRDLAPKANGHEHGKPGLRDLARSMRHARTSRQGAFAAGALSCAAVRTELERLLNRVGHFDWADIHLCTWRVNKKRLGPIGAVQVHP